MTFIPLVRVNSIFPFVTFLKKIGTPTQRFLRQAKLPEFALDNPENLIPLGQGCIFLETAARAEGIKALGVLVGHLTPIDRLGAFGRLLCQSLTLYDLFSTVIQSISLYNSGEQVWLTQQGDQVWLHHRHLVPANVANQQAALYTVMLYLNAIRLATEPEWRPTEIHLTTGQSNALTGFEFFSNTQIYFKQPADAICFPRSFLSLPLRHPLELFESQRQREQETLQGSAPAPDLLGSIQQVLRSFLREGYPDINLAAGIAGMSVRTFQRRLAEEDLNYSRLVEQVRFDMAVSWLRDPSIKLVDIALELGYSDPANFTRAFRRWAGVSPQEFRRQRMSEKDKRFSCKKFNIYASRAAT